ncbi:hypothetical protein AVDCRST_MAG94-4453 [uncultured Leptolyngbya sp.]|uniref:Uncharacterized protein n=1 Tax=uncultured Leptolyngbya sp. TaxID=332963 RepID=A0A6J4N6Y8_9CYAN|nr:hypothetical protein AVDCRST_MAG94-4453 [uncultured Leptolyngbya sp.]
MKRKKIRVQPQGFNPKSLENLNRSGKKVYYGEEKVNRNVSVSAAAWNRLLVIAQGVECPSLSEFVEQLGRGYLLATASSRQTQLLELQKRENKMRHSMTVTQSAWAKLHMIAKGVGARSISDLLERIGAGKVEVEVVTDDQPALAT